MLCNLASLFFRLRDVSLDLKLRLFNSCVFPIFTYRSESWTVTKHMEKRLHSCENRRLRRIMRITYKDKIANETIRQRTQQVQQYQTSAIKMALVCVTDQGQQTDQKYTNGIQPREKIKRTTEQKMNGLY